MAKGRRAIPVIASIPYLYHTVSQMPWEEIEGAAGKTFSAAEKREILRCTDRYSGEAGWIAGAAPADKMEELRRDLLEHCDALCSLADQFQPKGSGKLGTDERKVMDSLAVIHNTEGNDLRDSFHGAAEAARRLALCLRNEAIFVKETTARQPETAGLSAFLEAVLEDAEETDAKCNPGYKDVKPFKEYRRWDIAVGARCKGFPEFVSAVLGKKVTSGQIRKAWPKMWREAD